MLNAVMARAHRACASDLGQLADAALSGPIFEAAIMEMFRAESIAIVAVSPEGQYLYPEFILFKQLFDALVICTANIDGHPRAGTSRHLTLYQLQGFY
jgi:hypothetical protein